MTNRLIETLESRCLFSASVSSAVAADLQKLSVDVNAAKLTFTQYAPTLNTDEAALRTDLKATRSAPNRKLLAMAHAADLRCYMVMKSDAGLLLRTELADGRRVTADDMRIIAHPMNAALKLKLSSDVAALRAADSNLQTKSGTNINTCAAAAAAALQAVTTANPGNTAISNDVARIQTDGGAFTRAAGVGLENAQTDLANLIQDISIGA